MCALKPSCEATKVLLIFSVVFLKTTLFFESFMLNFLVISCSYNKNFRQVMSEIKFVSSQQEKSARLPWRQKTSGHILAIFPSHLLKELFVFRSVYVYLTKTVVWNASTIIQIQTFVYILFAVYHSSRFWCCSNSNLVRKKKKKKKSRYTDFEFFYLSSPW